MCGSRLMLLGAGLLCALAGCSPDVSTTPAEPPSFSISDGAHLGNPHFFFLPPMVPQPTPAGPFDGTRAPEVRICEWAGGGCATVIAAFTMATGPGSETVRVSVPDEHYIVNWHTSDFALDPSKDYRIQVLVDRVELGFADVELAENRQELRNVNTDQYVPLLEGRTVPIKFRIEEGGICLPPPPGMVAWWPGDDHANDITGGNHGTLQNGATFAAGLVGQAFSLDGIDDVVQAAHHSTLSIGLGELAIEAWVKSPPTNTYRLIVVKVSRPLPQPAYFLRLTDDNRVEFSVTDCGSDVCGFSLPGGGGKPTARPLGLCCG